MEHGSTECRAPLPPQGLDIEPPCGITGEVGFGMPGPAIDPQALDPEDIVDRSFLPE